MVPVDFAGGLCLPVVDCKYASYESIDFILETVPRISVVSLLKN